MPTINQLIKKGRERITYKSKSPILDKCPQKRGVCLSVTTTSPKKPTPLCVRSPEYVLPTSKRVRYTFPVKVTTFKNTARYSLEADV